MFEGVGTQGCSREYVVAVKLTGTNRFVAVDNRHDFLCPTLEFWVVDGKPIGGFDGLRLRVFFHFRKGGMEEGGRPNDIIGIMIQFLSNTLDGSGLSLCFFYFVK